MPYVTQIHVTRCRNVRDLDIESLGAGAGGCCARVPAPHPDGAQRVGEERDPRRCGGWRLVWALFSGEERDKILQHNHKRRRSPVDGAFGDLRLNVQQGGPYLGLDWNAPPSSLRDAFAQNEMIAVYLPSKRHIARQDVRGPKSARVRAPAELNYRSTSWRRRSSSSS